MKYAQAMGYDRLIVFDNESTDDTVELLGKYPFVEIRKYDTEGVFNEPERKRILMETVWELKEYNCQNGNCFAWCSIFDFDEVCYIKGGGFKGYIEQSTYCGYNVCSERIADLMLRCDPLCFQDEFLHEDSSARVDPFTHFGFNKPSLFRLDNLYDIDWIEGQHFMRFVFEDGAEPKQLYNTKCLVRFHLKYVFKRYYLLHSTDLAKRKYKHSEWEPIFESYGKSDDSLMNDWERKYKSAIPSSLYVVETWSNGNDYYEHGHQLTHYFDGVWG